MATYPGFGSSGGARSPAVPPVPTQIDSAGALVADVLDEAHGLAAESAARGLAAIAALGDFDLAIPALDFPAFDIADLDIPAAASAPADPGELAVSLPPLPTAPEQGALADLDIGEEPAYTLSAPLLIDIDLPDPLAVLVPAAPELAVIGAPVEPDFTLPPVPAFSALNLPAAPSFELAPFTDAAPSAPAPLDTAFVWDEVAYESDQLAALNTRLLDLVGGAASGLGADVEDALWHKGCDAAALLTFVAVDQALQDSAARGFSMPGGQLVRLVQQAINDALAKDAELSRSTMVEAARLEQQNFQFAFGQAMQLEARLIELFNQVQQRALEAARLRVAVAIELFNARLNLYQADVAAFGAKVGLFRDRLAAVLGRLELYKEQLRAVQIRGELNVQLAQQYSAQVEAVKTAVTIFKARVEAVALSVASNRNRTDLYRARVEAFAELAKSQAAMVQGGYLAQIQAQKTKAQMFGHQVAAYGGRVEAYRVLSDARLADVTFQVRQLQEFPMALYRARLDGYQAQVATEAARLGASADLFVQRVDAYAAVERANTQVGSAQAEAAATSTKLYAARAQIAVQDGLIQMKRAQTQSETAQSALRAAGQLTTQLASAAMSARNVSASLSGSTSNSAGVSASNGRALSSSVSVSSSSSTSRSSSSTTGVSNSAAVSINHSQSSSNNQTWSDSVDQSVSNSTSTSASNETSRGVRNSNSTSIGSSTNSTVSRTYQHKK